MRLQEPLGSGSKQRRRDSERTHWPTSPWLRDLCDLSVDIAGPRWTWPPRARRPQGAGGRDGTPGPLPCFLPPGWALRPRVPACVSMRACVPTFVTMSAV